MPKENLEQYQRYLDFIKEYAASSNAATGSVFDPNANVEQKNVTTTATELHKGDDIMINRLRMHTKLKETFGIEVADEYIRQLEEHEIYRSDETHPVYPYCVSITMYPFLFNGLQNIGGGSGAPHNLDSFAGSFCNLCYMIAAQFAGAVATPEFLSYMDYFIRKEYGDDYYLHPYDIVDLSMRKRSIDKVICDKFEQIVYTLNAPAGARNYSSIFWNIAYFDEPYFKGMFEDFVFPDGTPMKWESVSWLQKRFMKWFNAERTKKILTFPVETLNLLDDGTEYVDKEWADYAAEMLAEGHSFFIYRSNSVDSLASCCYSEDTQVIIKLSEQIKQDIMHKAMLQPDMAKQLSELLYKHKGDFVIQCSFGDIVRDGYQDGDYQIWNNGKWSDGKLVRLPNRPMYTIKTKNGRVMNVTDNHRNNTKSGMKLTTELQIGDRLIVVDTPHRGAHKPQQSDAIIAIEPMEYTKDVYCFEMADKNDDMFTLANGIHNYNCRLRNEVQNNTFSYTLGAGGVSTGSKGVITINMNRLIQNCTLKSADIHETLREQVRKIHKYLTAWNEILKEQQAAGLMPVYDAGYISLDKQYCTIGLNGLVEGCEYLGYDISTDDQGYIDFVESLLSVIYEENKAARTKELMFNTEFVPKTCGHLAA